MHSPEKNPLKRKFTDTNSDPPSDQMCRDGPDCSDSRKESSSPPPRTTTSINPRGYQLRVYEVAMKRNTLAVLETGTGKTMIAIMLIRDIAQSVKSSGNRKLIIFLAPTVPLVHQQYEEIQKLTELNVAEYFGAKGVDKWTLENWEKEIEEHDVLVMTPQVFLDALRNAFIKFGMACLIVIDECHHATGNHPYAKIMKEFYHKSIEKPKIFGMTASPVVRKGVSSASDCDNQLSELEGLLDSKIFTIEDRTEVETFAPTAKEISRFYDPPQFSYSELKEKMEISLSKYDASLTSLQESLKDMFEDMEDKFKTLQKRLSSDHAKILHCLDDLGLICAYEAVRVCLENISDATEECETFRDGLMLYKSFLEELLCIVGESLHSEEINMMESVYDYSIAKNLGYLSPKLHELLQIFQSFGEEKQILCLVFVHRIITAKVIERFMKKVKSVAQFTVSYLTGTNSSVDALTPKVQTEILESFRSGKVNLLFTTDVVEEGIHVPNCSYVIRFDLPKTVRSYVQSRGRARQSDSEFIMLLERGNMKQRDQLFDLFQSDLSIRGMTLNRDPETPLSRACVPEETNVYCVEATGSLITADSSECLLRRYCDNLPSDKFYTPKLKFEFSFPEGSCVVCTVFLPASADVQRVVGPPSRSHQLAKQLACLEACKKLHQMGALDDHLQLCPEEPLNKKSSKSKSSTSGAGTTKRKELHGTTRAQVLSGTWGEKLDGSVFHAYKFHFSCNKVGEVYSGFILLIESKLDDDVGNVEMELYLIGKIVKASVSYCGQLDLNAEQMTKAKCFQEFFFNGLFGKLFVKSKTAGTKRNFLLQTDTRSLWSPSYMYLLLPIDTSDGASGQESWRINWPEIDSCVSVVEFLKKNSLLNLPHNDGNHDALTISEGVAEGECQRTSRIYFANGAFEMNNLEEMVVIAIHTGRIYSIVEAVKDSSAESPFEAHINNASSEFSSYADYYKKKYGIELMHPKQPLMRMKQSHNAHNLLVNFKKEGDSMAASEAGMVIKKPQMHAYMPPELLASIGISRSITKSFYLIPSLIQRLESLMLASQLRKEINCDINNFNISSSLILEALTTLRCSETFSMERLELLGDSVLKYAVSCHLFLNYQNKHEGQLSSQRSSAICNSNLHRLGTNRELQGYIRDDAFEPRCWVAPGQRSLFPAPCKCGVDNLIVPLEPKFFKEDANVKLGKSCDMGHRWMLSKTVSDCVEALIGAYYVSGGLYAALHLMRWFDVDGELDTKLVIDVIGCTSLRSYVPKNGEFDELETKLGYNFSDKFLLKEAITHASVHETYSYQRLEFLGDSVLDILITQHLYQSHTEIDPGELTDLRAACVNNENFAQVAVRKNLYKHLQHCSTLLDSQINEYLESFPGPDDPTESAPSIQGPKALGDLVESIAGAILIDTKLNLDEVWRIFKPLLSPLATPDKLELPPFRELNELCDSLGYFIRDKCISKGEMVHAELQLQLHDVLLVGMGSERTRKLAKAKAASCLLKQLEKRNISRDVSKRRKLDGSIDGICSAYSAVKGLDQNMDKDLSQSIKCHKRKVSVGNTSIPSHEVPVLGPINMKKGGPRIALFEFCKKRLWPMPSFGTTEEKSRTPIEFGEGSEKRTGFNSYIATITLRIPNRDAVTCTGEARPDKKSSFDAAAVVMLRELEQRGEVVFKDNSE